MQITHTASYSYYYQTTPTQTRTFSYDGYGRLLNETTPEAGTQSYTYKANDLLEAATNANGKTVTYSYNTRNLLTTLAYSDTTPGVGYSYDAWGARTQMTDGEGQTNYAYNSYRQLQSEVRTFTGLTDRQYTLSYTYNQGDQVKAVNYLATSGYNGGAPLTIGHVGPTWAPPYTLSGTVTNSQGQPVAGVTVTLSGAATGTTTTNGSGQYSFGNLQGGTYTLTPSLSGYVFNPSSITYNDLQKSRTDANFTALPPLQTTFNKNVNYAYNTVGALSGVGTNLIGTDPNNTTNVINGLQFKAFGAIKQLNYGNGLQLTMGYNDTRQQPITMKVGPNGTGSIINYTYEYYAAGKNNNRIQSITDGVDSAYSVSYMYDKWNRLTNATASAYTRQYLYDPFGNLKYTGGSGGPNPNYTLNYAINSTNAPLNNRILSVTENGQTQPFTYDSAGNLTQGDGMTYAYDAANRMTSVNNGALGQYGYDGHGIRVKKMEGGTAIFYVRSSALGQVAFEVSSTNLQRAYVYVGNNLIAEQATDGQFYWLHKNHLSNARAMTDADRNVVYKGQFDPHGQPIMEWSASGNSNLNSRKFTGYERDLATGLDYANARSYKGMRGRFMQTDPVGTDAVKWSAPQSLNAYSYTGNDPVNYADPSGTNFQTAFAILKQLFSVQDSITILATLGIVSNNGAGRERETRGPVPDIETPVETDGDPDGGTEDNRTDEQKKYDACFNQKHADASQDYSTGLNEMLAKFVWRLAIDFIVGAILIAVTAYIAVHVGPAVATAAELFTTEKLIALAATIGITAVFKNAPELTMDASSLSNKYSVQISRGIRDCTQSSGFTPPSGYLPARN